MSIIIRTNDSDLVSDLKSVNCKGLRIMERIERNDSIDYVSIAEPVITIVVDILQNTSAGIITALILDRIQKKKGNKTEINDIDVTNNHAQVSIIINNYIQCNQKNSNNAGM